MTTLLIFMNVAFFSYVLFISVKYGIQPSVSESYYRLPRKFQGVFTLATWGYAIPAMVIGLDMTGNGLVFLAGSSIAFVGASPAFKKMGIERTVHTVGAIVGVFASQVFITAILGMWWITLSFAALSALAFIWKRMYTNFIWWVEIFAFLSISVAYFIAIK
jgi:hypothetical protein